MVTETWVKPSDTKAIISELTPPGFVLHHSPRSKQIKGKIKKVAVLDVSLMKTYLQKSSSPLHTNHSKIYLFQQI